MMSLYCAACIRPCLHFSLGASLLHLRGYTPGLNSTRWGGGGASRSQVIKFNTADCFNLKTLVDSIWVQLISVAFEHSVLRVQEIYALENAVFCIAVYGLYKP